MHKSPQRRSPVHLNRSVLTASCAILFGAVLVPALCFTGWADDGDSLSSSAEFDAASIEERLRQSTRYLASDQLQGRGVGSKGIRLAAEYIANQYAGMGLKTDLYDGTAFHSFYISGRHRLGKDNSAALIGPDGTRIDLKLGEDFTPLSISTSGSFDLPIAFAGYGITAKEHRYDDYAGLDATGMALIVLRREPQQGDAGSVFDGKRSSRFATFASKVANAAAHGAGAVIFCTDGYTIGARLAQQRNWLEEIDTLTVAAEKFKELSDPTQKQFEEHHSRVRAMAQRIGRQGAQIPADSDALVNFLVRGDFKSRPFPVLHCRRHIIQHVLDSVSETSLADAERQIDAELAPQSLDVDGWRLVGRTSIEWAGKQTSNVVGVLEGEGPLAEQTIVVGAHYDHLGHGSFGSLSGQRAIHNGADDNASGTAVMLEVARQLAARPKPLPRRVVFIAFTAEEMGLVGSARYVRNPVVPMSKTIAMINLDMVGRMRRDHLTVYGTGTAGEFSPLIDRLNGKHRFRLTKEASGYGPSDHSSFYSQGVPVLHFFTGLHNDYHAPSDDYPKLNIDGMRRIGQMVTGAVVTIATAEKPPTSRHRRRRSAANSK